MLVLNGGLGIKIILLKLILFGFTEVLNGHAMVNFTENVNIF